MRKFLTKRKQGSIALALVFSVMIAILMLGTLRVSMALNASNHGTEKQYATIQTLRSVTEVSCYSYVHNLTSCVATRKLGEVMPGTPDAVIYMEALEKIQEELATLDETGAVADKQLWRVQSAEAAIGGVDFGNPDMLAQLLAPVVNRSHTFQLRLEEDLDLNFSSSNTYMGIDEARVELHPVKIQVTLKVRSEMLVQHFIVEGLYMYVTRSEAVNEDGSISKNATMRITDDGSGSGVHIYRDYT